jgi:hypothetical protein
MNNLQYKEEAKVVNYKDASRHNNDNRNPMKMFEAFQAYNPNSIFDLFQNEKLQLNQTEFLIALNQQISNIQSIISTSGTVYIWDLLYPMYRIYFLKRVNYSLPINSSLSWTSLPASVQNNLINFDYDFTKNPNLNSISTQIKASLSLISLNSLIDVNVLKQKLNAIFDSIIDEGIVMMQNAVYEKHTSSGNCKQGKKVKRSDDTNNDEEQEQEQEGDFEHFSPKSERSFDSYTPPPNSEHLEVRRKRSNNDQGINDSNNEADVSKQNEEQENEGSFGSFTPPASGKYLEFRRKRSNNDQGINDSNNEADVSEQNEEQENEGSFGSFTPPANGKYLEFRRKRSNHNNKNGGHHNRNSTDSTSERGEHNHKRSSRVSYASRSSKRSTTKKV